MTLSSDRYKKTAAFDDNVGECSSQVEVKSGIFGKVEAVFHASDYLPTT